MESIILEKLSEINEIVLNYDNRNKFSFGLFGGDIGQVVFLFYYSRLIDDDQNTIKAQEKIERVVNLINSSDNVSFSFCDGLSGILWGLEHLKRNDFIYYDDGDFSGCDSAMVKQMNKLIDYGLYDYLHESLGICLFLLTREKYTTEILNFVEKLDKIKIICDAYKGIGWEYYLRSANMKVINLGLSHGLASIIAVLSKIYIATESLLAKELLLDSVKCLMCTKRSFDRNSLFPNYIFKNTKPISVKTISSRLAWCYGDLGISVAIWHASQALRRKDLEEEAKEILQHSAMRLDLDQNGVIDAGLCHGTAGIAHIYNRMYGYTGVEELRDASEYWFDQTLKMACFKDGLAGYKAWHGSLGWESEPGLLEGIAGIGLAMISAVSDIEPAWDECLLLS